MMNGKFKSRKFWMSIVSFLVMMIMSFKESESELIQAACLVLGGLSLITYVIAEGIADSSEPSITYQKYGTQDYSELIGMPEPKDGGYDE